MAGFADFETEIYLGGAAGRVPDLPMTAEGLERAAAEVMAPEVFSYVAGSAGTESTARAKRAAFHKWEIVPRHLPGVPERELAVKILGTTIPAPVLLAPVGALGAIRPRAELEVAQAAAQVGVPMTLSTLASTTMEQVAAELGRERSGRGAGELLLRPGLPVSATDSTRGRPPGSGETVVADLRESVSALVRPGLATRPDPPAHPGQGHLPPG